MTEQELKTYFQKIEDNFNKAVVSNDVEEIKKCISEDWVLVDAQGGIIPREKFFYVVAEGLLSHTSMTKELLRVKVYDNVAVITGRGKNTAIWQGKSIQADEWVTDIYKKEGNRWICVMTHLTPVKE